MQNVKVYYMPDSNDAFVKENDVDAIIKELNLYIEQLEAENMRLKNSIKSLRKNNKSMLQGLTKLQSYVHKLKRDLHYDNYWISLLVQNDENSRPYFISMTNSVPHLKDAMEIIERGRNNYRVLSAWVDVFDENNAKITMFHECYVDVIENVERK